MGGVREILYTVNHLGVTSVFLFQAMILVSDHFGCLFLQAEGCAKRLKHTRLLALLIHDAYVLDLLPYSQSLPKC